MDRDALYHMGNTCPRYCVLTVECASSAVWWRERGGTVSRYWLTSCTLTNAS